MKERGIVCPYCGGTAVPVARVRPLREGEELPIGGVFAGKYLCVSCGKEIAEDGRREKE